MTVLTDTVLKTVYELELDDGTIMQNVFYHKSDFVANQTDAAVLTALELWIEGIYANIVGQVSSSFTQLQSEVDEIEWNTTGSFWEVTRQVGFFTPGITYTNGVDPLPNQVAAIATFPTFRPKSRGRKFLPPFGEDQQDAGILNSTALTALANWATDALADVVVSSGNELITGVPREASNVFLTLASYVVTDILGTQRRRKPGVGV